MGTEYQVRNHNQFLVRQFLGDGEGGLQVLNTRAPAFNLTLSPMAKWLRFWNHSSLFVEPASRRQVNTTVTSRETIQTISTRQTTGRITDNPLGTILVGVVDVHLTVDR